MTTPSNTIAELAEMTGVEIKKPEPTNAQHVAKKFREMAKWLEQHPDVPIHKFTRPEIMVFAGNLTESDDETEKQVMARAAKAMGKGKKQFDDNYFRLVADTPPDTRYEILADRGNTCTKKVTGTKTVKMPAVEAKPAIPEREVEVDVVEWDCAGILEPDAQGRS
jgi:hypothetical protein